MGSGSLSTVTGATLFIYQMTTVVSFFHSFDLVREMSHKDNLYKIVVIGEGTYLSLSPSPFSSNMLLRRKKKSPLSMPC